MSKDESLDNYIESIEALSSDFLRDVVVSEDADPNTLYILPPDWQARLLNALAFDDKEALKQLAKESKVIKNIGGK